MYQLDAEKELQVYDNMAARFDYAAIKLGLDAPLASWVRA